MIKNKCNNDCTIGRENAAWLKKKSMTGPLWKCVSNVHQVSSRIEYNVNETKLND
jgi:hypothetical protein